MDVEEDGTQRAAAIENSAHRKDMVGDPIHSMDIAKDGTHNDMTLVDTGHPAHAMDFHWR